MELRIRFHVLALAALVSVATPTSILAQAAPESPSPSFRSAVDLVTIQASVHDARGRSVPGLSLADFEVRDNGLLRPLVALRSDSKSPLSLAILVDMSGSMRIGSKVAMAREVFNTLLTQLRNGQDEVALYTFDSSLHEQRGFTTDLTRFDDALSDVEPFGTTSLYDATASMAHRLAERPSNRKAIIVLTDGLDTSSTLSAAQVSGLASSIDVPVFVVATVPGLDERLMLEASPRTHVADLRDLAQWTGGQLVFASTLLESVTVAATLVNELRQQYVLVIESAGGAEWRRLDIRVTRRATVVKARSGYFGG